MGLAQHHDAVSGTEKQHVADDYAQRLSLGIDRAVEVINNAYAKLLPKTNLTQTIPQQFLCPFSNISACLSIEGQEQVNSYTFIWQISDRFYLYIVYINTMESNYSSSSNLSSCACHSRIRDSRSNRKYCSS